MANMITLGSLIDRTVDHYRKHFRVLAGISLWIVVAAMPFLFSSYIAPFGVDKTTPVNELIGFLSLNFLGLITTTVAGFWITACLILTENAQAKNSTPDHAALGKQSWKIFPALFLLSVGIAAFFIIVALALMAPGFAMLWLNNTGDAAGSTMMIIGGILFCIGMITSVIFLAKYSVEVAFAQYVLILENTEKITVKNVGKILMNSIKTSRAMVQGHWWATMLRVLVPSGIIGFIAYGATYLINAIINIGFSFSVGSISPLGITLISVASTVGVLILDALVMPLYSLATFYLYDSITKR